MKKAVSLLLGAVMLLSAASCNNVTESSTSSSDTKATTESTSKATEETYEYKYQKYAKMTPEEIVKELTLEQKAAQMVQPILYSLNENQVKNNCYGSIYGDEGVWEKAQWQNAYNSYQKAAVESEAGIPLIIAQDDAHGVGYCINAVYYPHNIGQGAANDEELAYQAGLAVADETKMCNMLWNLYPCVAQSTDPRWGRTYESYGADLDLIARLSSSFTKGLIDGGVVACAKHFFGDGNTVFGTGEKSDYERLIDRGDSQLTDEQIKGLLKVYQAQIDAGVQTIMVSYTSLNGKKMHEQKDYIMKLRDEMGFKGVIISDLKAVRNTSPATYEEQIISGINCGLDILMEGEMGLEAKNAIISGVEKGKLSEDRINESVIRIIKLKKDMGLFDDPFLTNMKTVQTEPGSEEYRKLAEKIVEKSLVLLKNEKKTLPLKEGTKVYITGPAADYARSQCGGWTLGWNASHVDDMKGVTTIKKAFAQYASDYGIEMITDPKEASKADVVLLCVGEKAYAEWYGDTEDLALCGSCGLEDNRKAIDEARKLGKPTVTCIIAGRQVILDQKDMDSWDSIVMCYLPGSEGKGISDVLCGCADFSGKLPSPWYGSVDQILTDKNLWDMGYGLTYGDGFTPRTEPERKEGSSEESEKTTDPMADTKYTKGVYDKGSYSNEYAGILLDLPGGLTYDSAAASSSMMAGSTNENDRARSAATFWDAVFTPDSQNPGPTLYMAIGFVNTKLGMPEVKDPTENDYLDAEKELTLRSMKEFGGKAEYSDREKVSLGGKEYVKETCNLDNGDQLVYTYVRKLDDDLMCVIMVSGYLPASDYEVCFKYGKKTNN